MTRSARFALALLCACAPGGGDDGVGAGGGASDGADGADGGGEDGADGGGEDGGGALECRMDPPLADTPQQVRVGPDGTVWLDQAGALVRYTREDGAGCSLTGEVVWAGDDLDSVTGFALDGEGRPWVLAHFSDLVQLDLDGAPLARCEVSAGHGVIVTPDAETAWVVGVGAEELQALDLTALDLAAPDCPPVGDPVALEVAVGPQGGWADGELVMATHDPGATLPPGVRLDPATGAVLSGLGAAEAAAGGDTPFALVDLAWTGSAWWTAGSPDGDLWIFEADGSLRQRVDAHELLGQPDDRTLNLSSVGRGLDAPSYIAAGFLDDQGLWANR